MIRAMLNILRWQPMRQTCLVPTYAWPCLVGIRDSIWSLQTMEFTPPVSCCNPAYNHPAIILQGPSKPLVTAHTMTRFMSWAKFNVILHISVSSVLNNCASKIKPLARAGMVLGLYTSVHCHYTLVYILYFCTVFYVQCTLIYSVHLCTIYTYVQ